MDMYPQRRERKRKERRLYLMVEGQATLIYRADRKVVKKKKGIAGVERENKRGTI